jgi:predicted nucleic acid-binding protein
MRLYLDTNVYGSAYRTTPPRHRPSLTLFQRIVDGRDQLVVSDLLELEILRSRAPKRVMQFYVTMRRRAEMLSFTSVSAQVGALALDYIASGATPPRKRTDALHVALATLGACDVLLSWDESDLVNMQRIVRYNQVNASHNLPSIELMRPDTFLQAYP